jgi:hypothetical protein
MKEYFLAGLICLLNPISDRPYCMQFKEDPIVYYSLEECKAVATTKVNEIAANFTSQGFQILELKIVCLVDKVSKNT